MYLFDANAFALLLSGEPNTLHRLAQNPKSLYLSSVSAEGPLAGRLNGLNCARSPRTSLSVVQAHEDFAKALADIQLLPLFVYSSEAERVFQNFPASVLRSGSQD